MWANPVGNSFYKPDSALSQEGLGVWVPHLFAGQSAEARFYLVSLGPGDADLITLRAIDTIDKSQVIVCGEANRKDPCKIPGGQRDP